MLRRTISAGHRSVSTLKHLVQARYKGIIAPISVTGGLIESEVRDNFRDHDRVSLASQPNVQGLTSLVNARAVLQVPNIAL
jgi:hypothetical protein